MNKAKPNRGWTLVELMVALMIAAILMASVGTMLIASINAYSKTASAGEAKQIGDAVADWVKNRLSFASEMQIIEKDDNTTVSLHSDRIRVENGRVLHRIGAQTEENVFGDGFYLGTEVKMTVTSVGTYLLNVQIEVLRGGLVLYQTQDTIELLNIKLLGGSITGAVSVCIDPKLVYDPA